MQVHVNPKFDEMIQEKVESGKYADASDVLTDALNLMVERDRRADELRTSIAEGFAQIERGESVELTSEQMDLIMQRAKERARSGKPANDVVRP